MPVQSGGSPISIVGRLVAMRRLHQVLLAAVAVASLLGFLLYKHEYERVSSLLHVLNTFGAGAGSPRGCDAEGAGAAPAEALQGVWQQIENVYVYSAFLEGGSAAVLGVVPASIPPKDIGVAKCLFWFEPGREGQVAELAVSFADEETRDSPQEIWKLVTLSCTVPDPKAGRPYALSLLSASQPESSAGSLPQIPLQAVAAPLANNVSLAVCSTLRSPHADPVLLTQFVKFHRQVGASRFTFYDLGISPKIHHRILALAAEMPDLQVQVLAWNFPFEFTEAEAPDDRFLQSDCLARNSGASYVLFSPVSTLVVPVYHSHVTNLLRDENSVGRERMGQMRLKERVFCTELESNPYTRTLGGAVWPMYLKTAWVPNPNPPDFFLVQPAAVKSISGGGPRLKKDFVVRDVDEDVAVSHSYRNCSPISVEAPYYDNSMMRRFLTQIR